MADTQQLLAEDKFGEGPFLEQELESLASLIKGCPWRRLALPGTHPVYTRLTATVEAHGGAVANAVAAAVAGATGKADDGVLDASSNMLKLSLELLSDLSIAGENLDSCGAVLGAVGTQLDEFASAHCKPTGHGADDEILAALLTLMMNVAKKNLGGADLLEMVNGRMFAAVAALTHVFRTYHRRLPVEDMLTLPNWRDDAEFFVACTRALYELSRSQTLFLRMATTTNTTTDRNMGDLDREYKNYLASFNKTVISFPVFDYIAVTLDSWFAVLEKADTIHSPQLLPYFQVSLKYTMQLICNMLTFTSSFSGQVKDHLAKNTVIIQNVGLPYICFALDLLERGVFDPETVLAQHIIPLSLVVRTISLVSFKIKMFRPWLRKFPLFGARLAKNSVILGSPMAVEFFALVVRFVINADLQDSIPQLLEIHASQFTEAQRSLIAAKLTGKKESLYPVNVFSQGYKSLAPIFAVNSSLAALAQAAPVSVALGGEGSEIPNVGSQFRFSLDGATGTVKAAPRRVGGRGGARGSNKNRRMQPSSGGAGGSGDGRSRRQEYLRRNRNRKQQKNQKRYQLLQKQQQQLGGGNDRDPLGGGQSASLGPGCLASASDGSYQGDVDSGDSGPEEEGAGAPTEMRQVQVTSVSAADRLALADQKLQELASNALLQDAYVAPNTVPVVGEKSEAAKAGDDKYWSNQTKRWFGVDDSDDTENEDSSDSSEEPTVQPDVVRLNAPTATRSTSVAAAPTTSSSSEGGLLTASADMKGANGEDLAPWRRLAPIAVPKQYLCALSRQLIDVPVISPAGEVFDKVTITDFLKAYKGKNLCPVTGSDLYANDLMVDQSLLREINAVRGNYVR